VANSPPSFLGALPEAQRATMAREIADALVFNYADFGRSDSSVGMTGGDIAVAADLALFFRFRQAKGRRCHKLNLS
jgi:hypothetical protein